MICSILFALAVHGPADDYPPEVRRELIKVEEFLSQADTIQTSSLIGHKAQTEKKFFLRTALR